MASITYSIPVAGQPNSTEDPKIATALTTLLAFANGGIDAGNLAAAAGIAHSSSLADHKFNLGSTNFTISGGTSFVAVSGIAHGLGTTPSIVIPVSFAGNTFVSLTGWDASNFAVDVVVPSPFSSGGGITNRFVWLAMT